MEFIILGLILIIVIVLSSLTGDKDLTEASECSLHRWNTKLILDKFGNKENVLYCEKCDKCLKDQKEEDDR